MFASILNLLRKEMTPNRPERSCGGNSGSAMLEQLEGRRFFSAPACSATPPDHHVDHPRVFAPHSTVHGKTMVAWSEKYWQWFVSYPTDVNPHGDPTGALGHLGEMGGVFFLAGSLGGVADRTIDAPSGEPIFFSPLNVEWSTAETGATTFAQLKALADESLAAVTEVHASIDGVPVSDLAGHVENSGLFQFNFPANNVFGAPAGVTNAVSDGYFIMAKPLSPGHHTVDFGGSFLFGTDTFSFGATYHLNVVPKGQYQKEKLSAAEKAAQSQAVPQPPLPGACDHGHGKDDDGQDDEVWDND